MDVSLIKFFGARVLHDVVDRALQIHGGLGYSTDMPLEMLYRYARHARFVDGADEVHRESVARQILKAYETPPDELPTEYVPRRRDAARAKFADVLGEVAIPG
jgi:acyl-CoA dehydrogenase